MMKLPRTRHDPQLRAAMEEIKAILKRYDSAAIVLLSSRRHMEDLLAFETSWSCATLDQKTGFLRIKAKREDYPSVEAHKQCVEETAGMFLGFADMLKDVDGNLGKIILMLGRHMSLEHVSMHEPKPVFFCPECGQRFADPKRFGLADICTDCGSALKPMKAKA